MLTTSAVPVPKIQLRPYQRLVVDRVMEDFKARRGFCLIQAATGAGKTIVFCSLIRELLQETPYLRIAVLAHRRELVAQARDKMLSIWPEAPLGIACHSLEKKSQLRENITIGTIQTLARQSRIAPFNIVIVDEVHRLPPKDQDSQFGDFLKGMLERNPVLQLLGVTATPYRLGHGYIFGQHSRTPWANWFDKVSASIRIETLQKEGFLSPYHYLVSDGDIGQELQNLSTTVGGDYRTDELEAVVIREHHLMSAVRTLQAHAADRKGIVIFCVSIEHANHLSDGLMENGIASASLHSEMTIAERDRILQAFDQGELRVLTNVNVLTEGWDSPRADCVMLCRPTLSTALYVQMVGRGLRIHPDKKDCLVLDLAGCFARHGSIRAPIVRIDGEALPLEDKGEALRHCPGCEEVIPLGTMDCPYCQKSLQPCVVYKDEEQNMVRINDRPQDTIFCEACARPFPRRDCHIDWITFDLDGSTPGILYCPCDHPTEALDAIEPIDRPGHFNVAHLKSRLDMAGDDIGLEVLLILVDEHQRPYSLSTRFGSNDDDRQHLIHFVQSFSDSNIEDHADAFGLPAALNRIPWDFRHGVELTVSDDRWALR